MGERPRKAHRLSYELNIGAIPAGLCVCHHCDTPLCCNPTHLFLGTRAENNADCVRKGRGSDKRGEKNPKAKLTGKDIKIIRQRREAGATQQALADRFGVSQNAISQILRGNRWQSVT